MQKTAIIVPCFKEAARLRAADFISFLQSNPSFDIFFVDDGSPDNTMAILSAIKEGVPHQVNILSLEKNSGKANAVRHGILTAGRLNYDYIGYLDADLATSLTEFERLQNRLHELHSPFVLGSRIKMVHTHIQRSFSRHIIGRIIATILDKRYRLGVYDTQCGAKCFRGKLVTSACEQPFYTRWFFDVELLLRIRQQSPSLTGVEIPLQQWIDPGGSTLRFTKFPAVLQDISRLFSHYPKPASLQHQ